MLWMVTYQGEADAGAARMFLSSVTSDSGMVPSQDRTITYLATEIADLGDPLYSALETSVHSRAELVFLPAEYATFLEKVRAASGNSDYGQYLGELNEALAAFKAGTYYGQETRSDTVVSEGPLTLTVPAGTFEVYHVSTTTTSSGGSQSGTDTLQFWLAKDIGPVQVALGDGSTRQLINATVNGNSIGQSGQTPTCTYTTFSGPAGWTDVLASGINNSGDIVGEGQNSSMTRGFVCPGGYCSNYIPIDAPPGFDSLRSVGGINNDGIVVGIGYVGNRTTGFVYDNGYVSIDG